MTKDEKEVMEMALDALEDWNFTMKPRPDEDIITAIKQALANDALEKKAENARELGLMPYDGGDYEPVAWLHRFIEGGISIGLKPADLERHPERWEPLYTTPPQQELVCVCGAVWEGQELIYTPPQQDKNEFKPDWDEKLALTEEVIRLSKRIEELEAQPEQKPVAWMDEEKKIIYWHNTHETDDYHGFKRSTPLYTTPPQRKPLTDEEILAANYPDGEENGPTIAAPDFELICFSRDIEAAHGIKGKQ